MALASWTRRWWWAVLLGGVLVTAYLVRDIPNYPANRVAEYRTTPAVATALVAVDPKDRLTAEQALLQYETDNQVKIWTGIIGLFTGVAAVVAGVIAYRNLRVTQERLDVDRQAQITNRFTQAIGQLGAELKDGKPNLEVRLGGIYALERIAKDSPRDHWTIMEVLTAYVRQNAQRTPLSASDDADSSSPEWPREKTPKSQDVAKPRTDIQAILTVLGRRTPSREWPELGRLDLTRADLRGANLSKTNLRGADLIGANLIGRDLSWAKLSGAILIGADLRGANLGDADLSKADLSKADLLWANLSLANLRGANLRGADLDVANLSEADLTVDQVKSARSRTGARLPPEIAEELDRLATESAPSASTVSPDP